MKYFICALDTISLGIPAENSERIIPVARSQTTVFKTENQEAYISLPVLFRQKDSAAPHGIILKPCTEHKLVTEVNSATGTETPKIILLTPSIDIDLEIPEEEIHSLPDALSGFLRYLSGVYFNKESVILILNIEKLMESIR